MCSMRCIRYMTSHFNCSKNNERLHPELWQIALFVLVFFHVLLHQKLNMDEKKLIEALENSQLTRLMSDLTSSVVKPH